MNSRQRKKESLDRCAKFEVVRQDHEPEIRKVTSKRKDIADQIVKLRNQDKELADEQNRLLKKRDSAIQRLEEELKATA